MNHDVANVCVVSEFFRSADERTPLLFFDSMICLALLFGVSNYLLQVFFASFFLPLPSTCWYCGRRCPSRVCRASSRYATLA